MDKKIQTNHFEYMVAMLEKEIKSPTKGIRLKVTYMMGSSRSGQCVNGEQ